MSEVQSQVDAITKRITDAANELEFFQKWSNIEFTTGDVIRWAVEEKDSWGSTNRVYRAGIFNGVDWDVTVRSTRDSIRVNTTVLIGSFLRAQRTGSLVAMQLARDWESLP